MLFEVLSNERLLGNHLVRGLGNASSDVQFTSVLHVLFTLSLRVEDSRVRSLLHVAVSHGDASCSHILLDDLLYLVSLDGVLSLASKVSVVRDCLTGPVLVLQARGGFSVRVPLRNVLHLVQPEVWFRELVLIVVRARLLGRLTLKLLVLLVNFRL